MSQTPTMEAELKRWEEERTRLTEEEKLCEAEKLKSRHNAILEAYQFHREKLTAWYQMCAERHKEEIRLYNSRRAHERELQQRQETEHSRRVARRHQQEKKHTLSEIAEMESTLRRLGRDTAAQALDVGSTKPTHASETQLTNEEFVEQIRKRKDEDVKARKEKMQRQCRMESEQERLAQEMALRKENQEILARARKLGETERGKALEDRVRTVEKAVLARRNAFLEEQARAFAKADAAEADKKFAVLAAAFREEQNKKFEEEIISFREERAEHAAEKRAALEAHFQLFTEQVAAMSCEIVHRGIEMLGDGTKLYRPLDLTFSQWRALQDEYISPAGLAAAKAQKALRAARRQRRAKRFSFTGTVANAAALSFSLSEAFGDDFSVGEDSLVKSMSPQHELLHEDTAVGIQDANEPSLLDDVEKFISKTAEYDTRHWVRSVAEFVDAHTVPPGKGEEPPQQPPAPPAAYFIFGDDLTGIGQLELEPSIAPRVVTEATCILPAPSRLGRTPTPTDPPPKKGAHPDHSLPPKLTPRATAVAAGQAAAAAAAAPQTPQEKAAAALAAKLFAQRQQLTTSRTESTKDSAVLREEGEPAPPLLLFGYTPDPVFFEALLIELRGLQKTTEGELPTLGAVWLQADRGTLAHRLRHSFVTDSGPLAGKPFHPLLSRPLPTLPPTADGQATAPTTTLPSVPLKLPADELFDRLAAVNEAECDGMDAFSRAFGSDAPCTIVSATFDETTNSAASTLLHGLQVQLAQPVKASDLKEQAAPPIDVSLLLRRCGSIFDAIFRMWRENEVRLATALRLGAYTASCHFGYTYDDLDRTMEQTRIWKFCDEQRKRDVEAMGKMSSDMTSASKSPYAANILGACQLLAEAAELLVEIVVASSLSPSTGRRKSFQPAQIFQQLNLPPLEKIVALLEKQFAVATGGATSVYLEIVQDVVKDITTILSRDFPPETTPMSRPMNFASVSEAWTALAAALVKWLAESHFEYIDSLQQDVHRSANEWSWKLYEVCSRTNSAHTPLPRPQGLPDFLNPSQDDGTAVFTAFQMRHLLHHVRCAVTGFFPKTAPVDFVDREMFVHSMLSAQVSLLGLFLSADPLDPESPTDPSTVGEMLFAVCRGDPKHALFLPSWWVLPLHCAPPLLLDANAAEASFQHAVEASLISEPKLSMKRWLVQVLFGRIQSARLEPDCFVSRIAPPSTAAVRSLAAAFPSNPIPYAAFESLPWWFCQDRPVNPKGQKQLVQNLLDILTFDLPCSLVGPKTPLFPNDIFRAICSDYSAVRTMEKFFAFSAALKEKLGKSSRIAQGGPNVAMTPPPTFTIKEIYRAFSDSFEPFDLEILLEEINEKENLTGPAFLASHWGVEVLRRRPLLACADVML